MKKILIVLTALCLMMTAVMSAATVSAADVVYGDVNGDGKVNNRDLGMLQQYLNDYDVTIDLVAADVTHDDRVNNRDLGLLQQYLNDWDVNLQPEEPVVPDNENIYNDTTLDWT